MPLMRQLRLDSISCPGENRLDDYIGRSLFASSTTPLPVASVSLDLVLRRTVSSLRGRNAGFRFEHHGRKPVKRCNPNLPRPTRGFPLSKLGFLRMWVLCSAQSRSASRDGQDDRSFRCRVNIRGSDKLSLFTIRNVIDQVYNS